MNLFASAPDVEFVRRRLLSLVESSSIPLPSPRRLALAESCRQALDGAELLDMSLEALADSAYLPSNLKDTVMESLMTGDWESVQEIVHASASRVPNHASGSNTSLGTDTSSFSEFRRMAITIFYASRKIQHLPLAARRELGSAILLTNTREELMHLFLTKLECSQTLDQDARVKIANDVLERRYYRLVREDRFDCESGTVHLQAPDDGIRISSHSSHSGLTAAATMSSLPLEVEHVWIDENTQDCPICLGQVDGPTTLPCQHVFCRDCIIDWAKRGPDQNQSRWMFVACPICRQLGDVPPPPLHETSSPNSSQSSRSVRSYLPSWDNFFNARF